MTGQLQECPADAALDGHTHFVLRLAGRRELRFRDVRKFGRLRILGPGEGEAAFLESLGPEPLEVDWPLFAELIRRRKGRLKSLLLNQRFLAGIGNIYADEILFEAGLHPLRPASRLGPSRTRKLWSSMRRVLARAVSRGGSSIRDYADAGGRPGRFQLEHKVYGRGGLACRRCGTAVRRLVVGGRSTHFCPRCQT
jgi:formamidopyrimidine-DNA glycosylase